jgi:hypothetical protein
MQTSRLRCECAGRSLFFSGEAVFFQAILQCSKTDSQFIGLSPPFSPVAVQNFQNEFLFHISQSPASGFTTGCNGRREGQIRSRDHLASCHDKSPLDSILQFPYISRPIALLHHPFGIGME